MPSNVAGPVKFRHENPLEKDILATGPLRTTPKKRKARRDEDEQVNDYVDSRSSRKILKIGQELEDEERQASEASKPNKAFALESRFPDDEVEDFSKYDDDEEEAWGDEEEETVDEIVGWSRRSDFLALIFHRIFTQMILPCSTSSCRPGKSRRWTYKQKFQPIDKARTWQT